MQLGGDIFACVLVHHNATDLQDQERHSLTAVNNGTQGSTVQFKGSGWLHLHCIAFGFVRTSFDIGDITSPRTLDTFILSKGGYLDHKHIRNHPAQVSMGIAAVFVKLQ